ncbi:MAG: AAA family ATPase [Spirochaetaceae bacterium]|nr:AAA family ATPase [Spirochaetaceae bacterium]
MTHPEPSQPHWFVGASYGGSDDQTSRFLQEGIWENGHDNQYLDLVRSMRSGERIAIKSTYSRKHDLPFDNRGEPISTMAIKAIGTITENLGDGKRVRVEWTKVDPLREWYFYTYRKTVWRVVPEEWTSDGLIKFAFEEKPQDIDRFRNAPYWADRFGDDLEENVEGISDNSVPEATQHEPSEPYAIDEVISEGCFLKRDEIERLLELLRNRKNLILQGPPGTGKTWLAKRLAFALMGERNEERVRAVQFHPNLSYEDVVRGWRPMGDGKLALADGVFMQSIRSASEDASGKFVVVIEELNRGNPAQIFGELLTLLDPDKRTPREAIELCYPDSDGKRNPVHIPKNLYVIGTMNIADRSLALVDLALRRRFAFVTLEPKLGALWREWVVRERGVDANLVADIERRINELNNRISGDPGLGKQFRIGHSFVTPAYRLENDATKQWFRQVAETEIGPQLEEYWFDAPERAADAFETLIEGW